MRWGWVLPLLGGSGCDKVFGLSDVHDAAPPCMSTLTRGDYAMHAQLFTDELQPSLTGDQTLIYVANAGTISDAHNTGTWSSPTPVASLVDPDAYEDKLSLSYDGRLIYFTKHPHTGGFDLPYVSTSAGDDVWAPATAVAFPSS